MEFFADTSVRPSELAVAQRELWHRNAWTAEQRELSNLVGVRQITSEAIAPDVYEAIYGVHAPWVTPSTA